MLEILEYVLSCFREKFGDGIVDFLPRASVLEESSKALKEYLGLMAGRIGIF